MDWKIRARAVAMGLGAYLCWIFFPGFLLTGISLFLPHLYEPALEIFSYFGTAITALAVALLFALCGWRFRSALRWGGPHAVSPWKTLRQLFGAVAFGVCANTAVSACLTLLPLPTALTNDYNAQSQAVFDPAQAALSLLSMVVLAPIFEELLFRGYIFRSFRRGFGFWGAAVFSSLFFGIAHGQLLWTAYAFGLGLLLCRLAEHSGGLRLSMAAHLGFNLTAVPQFLLPADSVYGEIFYGSFVRLAFWGLLATVLAVLLWKKLLRPLPAE